MRQLSWPGRHMRGRRARSHHSWVPIPAGTVGCSRPERVSGPWASPVARGDPSSVVGRGPATWCYPAAGVEAGRGPCGGAARGPAIPRGPAAERGGCCRPVVPAGPGRAQDSRLAVGLDGRARRAAGVVARSPSEPGVAADQLAPGCSRSGAGSLPAAGPAGPHPPPGCPFHLPALPTRRRWDRRWDRPQPGAPREAQAAAPRTGQRAGQWRSPRPRRNHHYPAPAGCARPRPSATRRRAARQQAWK